MLKYTIRKFIPSWMLSLYHKLLAIYATIRFWFPSHQLVVIGVTGTKGKTTTAYMIMRMLEAAGYNVGLSSTMLFKVNDKEWPNTLKQGMPGRMQMQKLLRAMVRRGCTHAVIETTSEGVAQYRHWGIAYDVVVFTNLSPEHIESHGSFTRYRRAKELIFKQLYKSHRKVFDEKSVPKVIVVNRDDEHADSFARHRADAHWGVWSLCKHAKEIEGEECLCIDELHPTDEGNNITIDDHFITLRLHGDFMVKDALLATAAVRSLGVTFSACEDALEGIEYIPGRMQRIDEGQNFTVVVDYAHEPASLENVLAAGRSLVHAEGTLIAVFGATGGGRDRAKRPAMGALAASKADYVILTTDDPYDDDPDALIDDIARGFQTVKKHFAEGAQWQRITDRTQAIATSLAMAREGDVVLVLGKGSETVMVVNNSRRVPWNDEGAVRDALRALKKK